MRHPGGAIDPRPGTELHFHVLPDLDDGPGDLDESIELARAAEADGTGVIVATPHVRAGMVTDVSGLDERVAELQAAFRSRGIAVRLHVGAELGHDMAGRLSQAELDSIAQGPPGARWLLVEAPFGHVGEDLHAATAELRDRGFDILLAHPERSAGATLERSWLRRELSGGALAQVNAPSITGVHGPEAREQAFALVAQGMASVVSSDAHGPTTRPPLLGQARAQLAGTGVDPAAAALLTAGTPRRLLERGFPRVVAAA